jgi:hypothetical protein
VLNFSRKKFIAYHQGASTDHFWLSRDVRQFARKRLIECGGDYGKPAVLSFQSECSGCGSVFTAFGTWAGRAGAVQSVETVALPSRESASSDSKGAAIRNACICASSVRTRISIDFSDPTVETLEKCEFANSWGPSEGRATHKITLS